MVSEPFDVTDDNGITVTGTVDMYRDTEGDYYDPTSPESYKNPRFADVHFDYFNTRGACTIDRNALRKAMEDALANALTKFGIEGQRPDNMTRLATQSTNATLHMCMI